MKYLLFFSLFWIGAFTISAQTYTPQLYFEIDGKEWDGISSFDLNENKTLVAKLRRRAEDTTIYYVQEYYLRYVFRNGPEGWYSGGTEAHHVNMITDGLKILPIICSIPDCTRYHHKMVYGPAVVGIQMDVPKVYAASSEVWLLPLEYTQPQILQIKLKK